MNRAEILQPGTRCLRTGLPAVSFDVDPAQQLAAARRILAQARRGEHDLVLRSHERDLTARAPLVVDQGAPADEPRTKRSGYRLELILAFAAEHKDGASRAQIAAKLGVPMENTSSPLKRLINAGKMRRSGVQGAYRYHNVGA